MLWEVSVWRPGGGFSEMHPGKRVPRAWAQGVPASQTPGLACTD